MRLSPYSLREAGVNSSLLTCMNAPPANISVNPFVVPPFELATAEEERLCDLLVRWNRQPRASAQEQFHLLFRVVEFDVLCRLRWLKVHGPRIIGQEQRGYVPPPFAVDDVGVASRMQEFVDLELVTKRFARTFVKSLDARQDEIGDARFLPQPTVQAAVDLKGVDSKLHCLGRICRCPAEGAVCALSGGSGLRGDGAAAGGGESSAGTLSGEGLSDTISALSIAEGDDQVNSVEEFAGAASRR